MVIVCSPCAKSACSEPLQLKMSHSISSCLAWRGRQLRGRLRSVDGCDIKLLAATESARVVDEVKPRRSKSVPGNLVHSCRNCSIHVVAGCKSELAGEEVGCAHAIQCVQPQCFPLQLDPPDFLPLGVVFLHGRGNSRVSLEVACMPCAWSRKEIQVRSVIYIEYCRCPRSLGTLGRERHHVVVLEIGERFVAWIGLHNGITFRAVPETRRRSGRGRARRGPSARVPAWPLQLGLRVFRRRGHVFHAS
ncbi:Uncharacterized protein pbN1_00440 [Aromatoleum bremense]|nr:Uncharacterized protein pbN1_00440 [Aromatoleum bremense]